MKWINLWIKNFRLYLHKIAFNLIPQQVFCTKAKKLWSQGKEKNFENVYARIKDVLHHNGSLHRSTNYKIMFLFTDPL